MTINDDIEKGPVFEEAKPNYPQPYNIKIPITEPNLKNHLQIKAHGRMKYEAKYKQNKRLYFERKKHS